MAKSATLTKALREVILDSVRRQAYLPELAVINADFITFSEKVYRSFIVSEQDEAAARIAPRAFVHFADELSIYAKDAEYKGIRVVLKFTKEMPQPASVRWNSYEIESKVLYSEIKNLNARRKAIENMRDELAAQVSQVLHSVNTVAKLIEVWPEAVIYIPKEVLTPPAAKINLPAIVISGLNELLTKAGLPVDAPAAA